MYFLAQFWHFEIFSFVIGDCLRGHFTNPNSQSLLHLLSFLTPSIPAFSKFWTVVESGCLAIAGFSLRSSGKKKANSWGVFLFEFST